MTGRIQASLLILCAALLALPGCSTKPAAPPNILLITVDTLRADRLGCYGSRNVETPAADALAHDGVLFEQAIAQVPLTWPSHVVMLTGTYPFHNGVQDFTGQPLGPEFGSLAQSLKGAGYATGAVVSSFVLDRSWGLARGFDSYDDSFSGKDFLAKDLGLVDRRAEPSVDRALSWLAGARDKRFFFWLHLFDPHSPYDPPEPFRTQYAGRLYDGEVAYADQQIGRLVAWLRQNALYDNTLIVFVSDHGESLGEHGEQEHGFFVYHATVRVPLIVKLPAGKRAAQPRITGPVETVSLPATILDLAGVQDPIQKQLQGSSLAPLILEGRSGPRLAYAETFYPFSSFGWSPLRTLESDRQKYVEAPTAELYDLRSDPAQQKNLAAQDTKTVAAFAAQLQALVKRYPPPARQQDGVTDPQAAEKLRSLGYVAFKAPTPDLTKGPLADPKNKLAEFNAILQATDAFSRGDSTRGRALLARVARSEPNLYLVPFLLGEAAGREGNWSEAVRQFERALKLNPGFDQAMTGAARALAMQGKSTEARQWVQKALDQNPNNFRAWFIRARIESQADPAAARAALDKVLGIQPNFSPALRDMGLLEIGRQEYSSALRYLERAVALGLDDAGTLNYLGIAYSRTGQLDRALATYQKALEADPKLAQAHLNLGFVYQRMNRAADAAREYETACRLERKLCALVQGQGR